MHFFFGISNEHFKSELQIPVFKHTEPDQNNYDLYKLYPLNNKWIIEKSESTKQSKFFYILKDTDIANNEVYFLATRDQIEKFNNQTITRFNNFKVRANLKVYLLNQGFSSYQSDYPYEMIFNKNGNIVASVNSLANKDADKNFIFFKNIFVDPEFYEFEGYFIDFEKKRVEKKIILKTNYSNCIEIEKYLIKPEIFFVTKNFIGIPIFISTKNGSLSVEHTHPPHSFIIGENRFKTTANFKRLFSEIIN